MKEQIDTLERKAKYFESCCDMLMKDMNDLRESFIIKEVVPKKESTLLSAVVLGHEPESYIRKEYKLKRSAIEEEGSGEGNSLQGQIDVLKHIIYNSYNSYYLKPNKKTKRKAKK